MRYDAADIIVLKVAAAASIGTSVFGGLFVGGDLLPFFRVSLTTLGMAAAGSLLAFTYGTPIKGNGKLFGFAMGGVFIGIWSIHIMRWQGIEVPEEVAGPIAGFIALIARWALPAIVETLPGLWRGIVSRVFGITMENKK